ncbi:MAG: PIG-L deacetylase family protein [Jatrophihabitans sp.]
MSTVVCFHAHPDDEALLTGGSIARWHAERHRVVLVVATDGEAGLTDAWRTGTSSLAEIRRAELGRAGEALGLDRIVFLGFPDSGWHTGSAPAPGSFATADVASAAARLAAVLEEESADVLTVYDAAGGYGHPDHVQVHRVGLAAAKLARTPVVLEATVDRRALLRAVRFVEWVPGLPDGFSRRALAASFADPALLTHRVDVLGQIDRKRAALKAHASQQGGPADRTVSWFLRLPRPVFQRVFRYEWFIRHGSRPGRPLATDPLADDGRC